MRIFLSMIVASIFLLQSTVYAANSIYINIPTLTLTLLSGDKVVKRYPIAAGMATKDTHTITGNYHIIEKTKNPTYTPTTGGDPIGPGGGNPLGPRWMRVTGNFGVHGNANAASIGTFASHGCMRMYNFDVTELFEKVNLGTAVSIDYNTKEYHANKQKDLGAIVVYPDIYGKGANNFNTLLNQAKKMGIPVSSQKQRAIRNTLNYKRVTFSKGWTAFTNNSYITSDTTTVRGTVYANTNDFIRYFNVNYKKINSSTYKLHINSQPSLKVYVVNHKYYSKMGDIAKAFGMYGMKYDYALQTIDAGMGYVKYKGKFLTSDMRIVGYRPYVGVDQFTTDLGIKNKLKYSKGYFYLKGKLLSGHWHNNKFYADADSLARIIGFKADYWSLRKFVNFN